MADTPTPGPWLVRRFPARQYGPLTLWVVDDTPDQGDKFVGQAICSVTGTNPNAAANARLIAAAPDLLDACQEALGWADLSPALRDTLAAAIARATGGEVPRG